MDLQEFARKGGKARWRGIKKAERSKIMKEIRGKRPSKATKPQSVDNELARS